MTDYYALYGIFDSTRYAFPGSEEKKRPRDFVPLLPPAEIKDPKTVARGLRRRRGQAAQRPHPQARRTLQLGDEVPRRYLAHSRRRRGGRRHDAKAAAACNWPTG